MTSTTSSRSDITTGNEELNRPRRTLALLGAAPAFAEPLHVGRPNIGDRQRFADRVTSILDRRWLTNDGPVVRDFEQRVAHLSGVRHCVAVCNATIALQIAVRALNLTGEVILPSYTFVATAHALQWQDITPIFADLDPSTLNIAPAAIERLITSRTTGIIGVHVWGRPCETDSIEAIAAEHGLKVIYDAAHAFGCSHRGRMIGAFGACEVFSFHATKFINCFEGGAVVTNDDALANKLRLMRNFGFAGYDRVVQLGTNGKMTEVCAAMGLTSLEAMDEIVAINRRNHEAYCSELRDVPGLSVMHYDSEQLNNYQYVVVQVDPDVATLSRDEIVAVLHAENVLARRYFWPGCHGMEPYRSLQPNVGMLLPETERLASRIMVLPTGQAVSEQAVRVTCDIIRTACSNAAVVRQALSTRESAETMAVQDLSRSRR